MHLNFAMPEIPQFDQDDRPLPRNRGLLDVLENMGYA